MEVFLKTEHLILRRFTEDDASNLFELDSDLEVMRFINGGKPTGYEKIRNSTLPLFLGYYERYDDYDFWAAIEKSSGRFVGWFHFRPFKEDPDEIEFGYRLLRSVWGKGYATEGSRSLVRKGFSELGVQRVVATALAENAASIHVMEKAGLKFEKRFTYRNTGLEAVDGREAVKYGLDRNEFRSEQHALT